MPAGRGTILGPGSDARGVTVPVGSYLACVSVNQASFLRRITVIHQPICVWANPPTGDSVEPNLQIWKQRR